MRTCIYNGRRFVCGDQSGRTSAPINPHAVQIILPHSERTGVSSGSQSAFRVALWLHQTDSQ
jgi:hypothetical protein